MSKKSTSTTSRVPRASPPSKPSTGHDSSRAAGMWNAIRSQGSAVPPPNAPLPTGPDSPSDSGIIKTVVPRLGDGGGWM